jgi:hypothetical protein
LRDWRCQLRHTIPTLLGLWVVAQTPILDARERQSHDGYSDSARCEHLNAVPVVGLGPIERSVGVANDLSRDGGVLREDGDPEARGDGRVAS